MVKQFLMGRVPKVLCGLSSCPPEEIEPHPIVALDLHNSSIIYFQSGDLNREEAFLAEALLNTDGPDHIL